MYRMQKLLLTYLMAAGMSAGTFGGHEVKEVDEIVRRNRLARAIGCASIKIPGGALISGGLLIRRQPH